MITGLSINPGGSIFIRWTDTDTTGSDDGVAIDDVSVTATISSDPTPPGVTGSIAPNPAAPGLPITLSGTIQPGFNPLSQSYTITCNLSRIGGAANQALPVSNMTFSYVRPLERALRWGPIRCRVRSRMTKAVRQTLASASQSYCR